MSSSYLAAPLSLRSLIRSLPTAPKLNLGLLNTLYRQRRDLGDLEPHMLDDIGLTQAEAKAEARRPVWNPPAHWLAK